MKKTKIILTMATMVSAVAFTGCSAEISLENSDDSAKPTVTIQASMTESTEANNSVTSVPQNKELNNPSNVSTETKSAETKSTENEIITYVDSQSASIPDVFTEVNEDWNYALLGEEEFAYSFEVKYDETTYKEYATIICQGDKGTYWTYETDKYEVGQSSAVELLESPADRIFLNEGGTITAINITDGKVLWQNSEYQGSGSVCTMDENDNLYVAGYEYPGLMIIDANGQTICRAEQFGDYFWPYEMSVEDNMLTILFDSEDNAKVVMDIRDHSYTIN